MTCNFDPTYVEQSSMKGIIEEKRVKWSDYAPIMVNQLPFYIRAEVGAPVSTPCRIESPWKYSHSLHGTASQDDGDSVVMAQHCKMMALPQPHRRRLAILSQGRAIMCRQVMFHCGAGIMCRCIG